MKEMRDRAERVRTEETSKGGGGVGGFQEDDIKTRERRQTGTGGAEEGDKENTGDEKKDQGIRQAAIKRGRRERKKDSAVDEAGLTQNRKGKEFFEVQCSNLSFVPIIVQHLPQLISVKLPLFSSHSHPPSLPLSTKRHHC